MPNLIFFIVVKIKIYILCFVFLINKIAHRNMVEALAAKCKICK